MSYRVLIGDNRETLRTLPEKSVQCVVTSPPYYGLRDYGNDGQIGLESTPDEYVAALVDVFREVRRVLRDDGVVWLNLGDSYAATTKGTGDMNSKQPTNAGSFYSAAFDLGAANLKPKDLIGIPWRVAFALQADGWYLRQDIIWHKPNPMPESVTDRCTKAHEYLFLLSKSARYFYDAEAVKEATPNDGKPMKTPDGWDTGSGAHGAYHRDGRGKGEANTGIINGRNRRSVWTIATQPYSGAHFATFPPKLIEPCILAGTPEHGCCPHCGAPWERVVETPDFSQQPKRQSAKMERTDRTSAGQAWQKWRSENPNRTTGHQPTCTCPDHEPVPSTVLDPFGGSGTTAGVALEHGRDAILCELSEEYAELIPDRINGITDALQQGRLFA